VTPSGVKVMRSRRRNRASTPEGVTFAEQRRLTRAMLRRGHRVFSLTYHSPSLLPGNTPYVRNAAELGVLLDRIETFLRFFIDDVGGRPATPFEVRDQALRVAERAPGVRPVLPVAAK